MSDTPDTDGISSKNGDGLFSIGSNTFDKTVCSKPFYLKGNLFTNKYMRLYCPCHCTEGLLLPVKAAYCEKEC